MCPRIRGFILLWITTGVFTASSNAEESFLSTIGQADLPLKEFVESVVATNPRIKAARVSLSSGQALRDAESQPLYNPDFTFDADQSDNLNGTFGISQKFDWSGKRKARTEVANSNLRYAEAEFLSIRRAFTAKLLEGLASYQISRKRHDLVLEHQQLMNDLVDRAESRFEAGDISQVDLDLVELAALNVRIRCATVKAAQLQAREDVQLLTPQTDVAKWPVLPNEFPDIPTDIDSNLLIQQIPEVVLARLSIEKTDSLVELRRKERLPDPTVSLRGGQEDEEFLVGLNITIPLFIRNSYKYEFEAVVAERNESQLIADDVKYRALVVLESSLENYRTLRAAWVDWQSTSEENLSRPLDQLQRLWETGEVTTTDYVVQLTQTLEVRKNALDLNELLWQAWFRWLVASGQIDAWLGVEF